MTYEAAIIYLSRVPVCSVADESLIGWEQVTNWARIDRPSDADATISLAHTHKDGAPSVRLVRDSYGLLSVWRAVPQNYWQPSFPPSPARTYRKGESSPKASRLRVD
jgi:hypothetical protein